ncbi:MAG TPA: GGDEF domain-containing protein [Oscillospiraceae bacterium]|nr:GGDEF domain-containing protein [Oscillospiraceae bacterium]
MNFTSNIIIDLYSIVLVFCLYMHTTKEAERDLSQQRLYRRMLQVTLFMLVLDIFSRFDGNPTTLYSTANHVANFLTFSVNLFIPSLWLLYVYFQVFHDEKRLKRLSHNLVTVNIINAVIAALSLRFGWLYYIDSNNIYHRGPLFCLPVCIIAVISIASFGLIALNHKRIERRYLSSLIFFPIPPIVCIVLQVAFYGTSLMLSGCTISLLIIFFNIQNRSMNIDYLTGAYNRRGLEIHMGERVNTSSEDKTFSAIWIDLDNFKYINDTFGHNTGDQVLKTTVKLLRSCFRPTDFIARLGGDEFCIVLDLSNRVDLEAAVARIKRCVKSYNERGTRPYKLAMSMGYAVYDYRSRQTVEKFQKQIDELMYREKQAKKKLEV